MMRTQFSCQGFCLCQCGKASCSSSATTSSALLSAIISPPQVGFRIFAVPLCTNFWRRFLQLFSRLNLSSRMSSSWPCMPNPSIPRAFHLLAIIRISLSCFTLPFSVHSSKLNSLRAGTSPAHKKSINDEALRPFVYYLHFL